MPLFQAINDVEEVKGPLPSNNIIACIFKAPGMVINEVMDELNLYVKRRLYFPSISKGSLYHAPLLSLPGNMTTLQYYNSDDGCNRCVLFMEGTHFSDEAVKALEKGLSGQLSLFESEDSNEFVKSNEKAFDVMRSLAKGMMVRLGKTAALYSPNDYAVEVVLFNHDKKNPDYIYKLTTDRSYQKDDKPIKMREIRTHLDSEHGKTGLIYTHLCILHNEMYGKK